MVGAPGASLKTMECEYNVVVMYVPATYIESGAIRSFYGGFSKRR